VPQEALVDAAVWYTQLDMFDPAEQILETRLQAALASAEARSRGLANREAALSRIWPKARPRPGGGSAAAHAGAPARHWWRWSRA
jgi:glutamate formiminotransferase / formiminotetrahydrofolate cyclodeaminase